MSPRFALLLALALALAWPAAAAPPTPEREKELTAMYQTAQEHFLAERYTEALPLFDTVARELDSPNAWLYVARTQRALGRPVAAYSAMKIALARATERGKTEPRFQETATHAAEELKVLETEIGRVVVVVTDPPAGLVVEVGGEEVTDPTAPVVVAPGRVRVEARAPGREASRREVDVAPGGTETVTLELSPLVPPPGSAVSPPPPPPPAPATPAETGGFFGPVRIAGMAVAGLGVVGWVAFGVGGAMGDSKFADIEQRCGHQRCTDPALNGEIEEGRTLDIVANAGLAVGIAGTLAGTLMLVFGAPSEPAPVALGAEGIAVRF